MGDPPRAPACRRALEDLTDDCGLGLVYATLDVQALRFPG
jgi:hypothetical protein